MEWDQLKDAFDACRTALGLARDVGQMLPSGDQRAQAIEQAVETAEQATRLAEAKIAKALGYKLCQCTFPPQIMLFVGYDDESTIYTPCHVFRCARCGAERPHIRLRRLNQRQPEGDDPS